MKKFLLAAAVAMTALGVSAAAGDAVTTLSGEYLLRMCGSNAMRYLTVDDQQRLVRDDSSVPSALAVFTVTPVDPTAGTYTIKDSKGNFVYATDSGCYKSGTDSYTWTITENYGPSALATVGTAYDIFASGTTPSESAQAWNLAANAFGANTGVRTWNANDNNSFVEFITKEQADEEGWLNYTAPTNLTFSIPAFGSISEDAVTAATEAYNTYKATATGFSELFAKIAEVNASLCSGIESKNFRIITAASVFSANKAIFDNGTGLRWKDIDNSDVSMIWELTPVSTTEYIMQNSDTKRYPGPQTAGNTMIPSQEAQNTVTFTALSDAAGQYNIKSKGSNDPFHMLGHNNGAGTEGAICVWASGANSCSAWTLEEVEAVTTVEITTVVKNGDTVISRTTENVLSGAEVAVPNYFYAETTDAAFTATENKTITYTVKEGGDYVYIANYLTPTKFVKADAAGLAIADGLDDNAKFRKIMNTDGGFALYSDALNMFVKPSNSVTRVGLTTNLAEAGATYTGKHSDGTDWFAANSAASGQEVWVDDHCTHESVAVWSVDDAGAKFIALSEDEATAFAGYNYTSEQLAAFFTAKGSFNAAYALLGEDSEYATQAAAYLAEINAITYADNLVEKTTQVQEYAATVTAWANNVGATKVAEFDAAFSGKHVRLLNNGKNRYLAAGETAVVSQGADEEAAFGSNVWKLIPTDAAHTYIFQSLSTGRYLGFNTANDSAHPTHEAITDAVPYEVIWITGDNFGFRNNAKTENDRNCLHINGSNTVCWWNASIGSTASYWSASAVAEKESESVASSTEVSDNRTITLTFPAEVTVNNFAHLSITLTPSTPAIVGYSMDTETGVYTVEPEEVSVEGNVATIALPIAVGEGEYTLNVPAGYFKVGDGLNSEISEVAEVKAPVTGIDEIVVEGNAKAEIFDLQGRRVNRASKGLFIVNGVKTLVR